MILFSTPRYEYLVPRLLKITGAKKGDFTALRFLNKELYIKLKSRVAGHKCVILAGTAPPDKELLELLLLSHTLKKEGAREIIALIPYLGYSRQDKKESGKSLAVAWLGNLLLASGVAKVLTLDVHSPFVVNFFSLSLISISSNEIFTKVLKKHLIGDVSIVAPDEGAIERCESLRRMLKVKKSVAYFKKKRTAKGLSISELQGRVESKVLIIDDILDTGETLLLVCKKLRRLGVKDMVIAVTHGLFTGKKWRKLRSLGVSRIYCTDSVPAARKIIFKGLTVLPIWRTVGRFV